MPGVRRRILVSCLRQRSSLVSSARSQVAVRDGRPASLWRTVPAAEKLGVEVRIEPFETPAPKGGGLCVVRGEKLVLIDQRAPLADRVLALARAVTELENETIYMAPEAREFIEAIQGHVDLHRQRLNIWDEGPSGCLEETRAVKKDEVLAKLAAGELKVDQASKLLEESEREGRGKLSCRVSEKGGVSVYGLQRMPVTLYVEQWEKLLGFADEIRQFLKEHDSELKRKPK